MFALRRLLADADEQAIGRIEGGHFAGIPLDYAALDTRYPYQVGVLQARVKEILESRLAELGGELRRDWRLTGFEQDDEGVTVHGPPMLRARYLVGCDGGRSTVRRLLGIGFRGTMPLGGTRSPTSCSARAPSNRRPGGHRWARRGAVPSDRVFALLTTSGGHLPSGLPTTNGVNLSCGGAVGG